MEHGIYVKKLRTHPILIAAALLVTTVAYSAEIHYRSADRRASRQVHAMLDYLEHQRGKGLISGQVDLADAQWVQATTGRTPAILGLDFMHTPKRMGGETGDTLIAIDWFRKKHGLITYQWHWSSPSGAKDPGSGFYANKTDFNLAKALSEPDSPDYKGLIQDIDDVAHEFKKLADASVPVLFRPLHEAQGAWFWWGASGAESCKKLYRLMVDRITNFHRIHNIAWVWTAYPASTGKGDPADWYPGDDCVDIVVSDYNEKKQHFDELTQLTGGRKMVALAETMNAPDPARVMEQTPWAYWVTWARRDWNKNSVEDMKRAMSSPLTITRDGLPDVSKW